MGRPRYRSASGGSVSEMTTPLSLSSASPSPQAVKASREVFEVLIGLGNSLGGSRTSSFLHAVAGSNSNDIGLAQALMDRAAQLDHVSASGSSCNESRCNVLEQLLLAQEKESGYTPLHCAMMERNLAVVLQILRQAASFNNDLGDGAQPRLAHRPMQLLQGDAAAAPGELVNKLVQVKDYEGLNPLDLLCRLQQTELKMCRQLVSPITSIIDNGGGGRGSPQNEFHVLQEAGATTNNNSFPSAAIQNVACEVLTFGRVNHVALGESSSEKSNNSNNSQKVRPQRVQAFGLARIGKDQSAIAVAAASHHTLVATRSGRLYAFGLNKGGRLGTGNERHCPVPTRVLGPLARRRVVAIAAAENHSLCVTAPDGVVYAWGSNRFGQLGNNNNTTADDNNSDQQRCLPRRVESLTKVSCVSVAAGDRHSVALSNVGEVYTWGDNQAGQLGITLRGGNSSPTSSGSGGQQVNRVDALWAASPRKVARAISAAAQSTLVLTTTTTSSSLATNTVYSWGHGNHVPIRVNFADSQKSSDASLIGRGGHVNPVAISCAKYHNAAVTSDGRVFTWGLHAEPLGTSKQARQHSSSSSSKRSMVIASPQLVTGMLSENGGGIAVAVSACENHTAVLTDCGHLYTWGATYGKDVLGHEGVRWQPSPKKVPGVYRAVSVAAAKEHTVLLVGTSFPNNMKPTTEESCPSLELLAAQSVAQHVDLFNVIPILVIAERTSCSFLIDYCQEFVRLNLDGVLTLGKKSEMDRYLNDKLADGAYNRERYDQDATSYHPLLFDVVGPGSPTLNLDSDKSSDGGSWMVSCKDLLDRLPISLLSKHRAGLNGAGETSQLARTRRDRGLSFSGDNASTSTNDTHTMPSESATGKQVVFQGCSERCMMLTANMSMPSADSARSKHECLSKEVRGVRKRLNQIAKLSGTEPELLSDEQQEKLARRPLLEADLVVLEKALLQVQEKMESFGITSEESKRVEASDNGAHEKVVEKKDVEDEKAGEPTEANVDVRSSFRCDICQVNCSDASSFAFHQSGRKHRNRVKQAEDQERKDTAASMMEMKRRQLIMTEPEMSIQKPSPWQKKDQSLSVQPKYKLAPPPAFPSPETRARPSPSTVNASASWSSPLIQPSKRKSSSFRNILEEEEKRVAGSSAKSFAKSPPHVQSPLVSKATQPWASPTARTPQAPSPRASSPPSFSLGRALADSDSAAKKSYSLGDFLTTPSATTSTPTTAAAAPWMAAASQAPSSAATAKAPVASHKSFMEIQREEEDLRTRQDQSCGMDGQWFVQQRERAGSISKIQEEEARERDHQLLVEEQMRIEQEIARELEEQKKKEANKKRNKRTKKKHPQRKQSGANKKQSSQTSDGTGKGNGTSNRKSQGGNLGKGEEKHVNKKSGGGDGKKGRTRRRCAKTNQSPKPNENKGTATGII